MPVVLTVLGVAVILMVLVDVFLTILSTSTAGPLTRAWSRPMWKTLLAIHRRTPIHRALSMTGPLMVVISILVWYGLLVFGTWLIYVAHPGSVVNNTTRIASDPGQVFYFVPTTLTGLGYGDLVPDGYPWTAIATTMALLGTFVLTLSLSYVISVVSAAIARRAMASGVRALGDNPVSVVRHAQLDDPVNSMQNYVASVASLVSKAAESQRAYPVLRYFHSARAATAAAPAVLLLADAAFLLRIQQAEHEPVRGITVVIESAVAEFIEAKTTRSPPASSTGENSLRAYAVELGIDVDPTSVFERQLNTYLPQRETLVAACADDGWTVP
ncbi:ion channel [Salinibacterium sp. TMP30]|uniref:ion channel n=1 Tax=Salinibacterium sp. TMP30 TaxID=3138237 RepID=UPI00313A44D7